MIINNSYTVGWNRRNLPGYDENPLHCRLFRFDGRSQPRKSW